MTKPLEAVTDWENNDVNGLAFVADSYFEEQIGKAHRLRKRQSEYLDSLPSDPEEAIKAALNLMKSDTTSYPEGIEDARFLSAALLDLLRLGELQDGDIDIKTAVYLADQVESAMRKAVVAIDKANDLLRKPL